jgi:hypothetical protein
VSSAGPYALSSCPADRLEQGRCYGFTALGRRRPIGRADLVIALAAVYRPVRSGLERHLGFLAALGTDSREHLPLWPAGIRSIALCLPGLTAGGAALRVISVTLRSIELLLGSSEGEGASTIRALNLLVFVGHLVSLLSSDRFAGVWLKLAIPAF